MTEIAAREATFGYLDKHFDDLVEQTQQLVRQPSNSLTDKLNPDVFKCADLVELYLRRLGCERVEQCHFENGYPVVYAEMLSHQPNAKWLIVSCLYDVVPWDEDDWMVDPLGAEIYDAKAIKLPPQWGPCLTGRGAKNQKGPLMSVLQALKGMREVEGDIPVNLMFALEGEEEIASPHLREFRDRYLPELSRASAAYLANPWEDEGGNMLTFLGLRGIVHIELIVKGGEWGGPVETSLFATDVAWVDSPAWRLIWALSTFQDPTGKILVEGFGDDARPWTAEERKYVDVAKAKFDDAAIKRRLGIKQFRCGMPGAQGLEVLMTQPLINIDGMISGYTGPAVKTSFPKSATAKLDFRLVPGMKWEETGEQVRRHLAKHGFPEVEVKVNGGYNATRTPESAPIVQAALRSSEQHGHAWTIWPIYRGSNPMSTFNGPPLNLPVVSAGIGKHGRSHQANEYITLSGLSDYAKWMVTFLHNWAAMPDERNLLVGAAEGRQQ